MLTLILGGARSGKSALGEAIARQRGKSVVLIATMEARDEEMTARIAAHRSMRPAAWQTLEEPLDVLRAAQTTDQQGVILLDCVTMWVSNLLLRDGNDAETSSTDDGARQQRDVLDDVEAFAKWAARSQVEVIAISNEVGLGVVPPYPLGRVFRDCQGAANQLLAARATRVYYLVAGLGFELKGQGGRSIAQLADDHHAGLER